MELPLQLFALPLTALCLTAALPADAESRYVRISSGTGFVINNEGHVVTNEHVVRGCQSISILTPKGEEPAKLVAADSTQDLAVLKTHYISRSYAPLRWNIKDLRVGEEVVVRGYPGEAGARGEAQTKKTRITALKGPRNESDHIQLTSVAAHGNSGGPVLDSSGNVIAVISGIAVTYQADRNGEPSGKPIGQADIAITLSALQDFLHRQKVSFYEATSNLGRSDVTLRDSARHFIIPVRCIQGTATR